ncbi:MAG: hypothetical protein CVV51_09670 [Spirochaetae bacterium HGW-Spirochaetae-7]|jgi:sugar phosphate isomerase/epimerase|nr:MAG: hypothetical protein CVV51_09670 [Spirochaetae bacterium HGW-Spirochaetae-7]
MIGVSPAYFLSRHGPSFGPREIERSLPFLADSGYDSFQAEVVQETFLDAWNGRSSAEVNAQAGTLGLRCSAFVAHFLCESFSSMAALLEPFNEDSLKRALAIASSFTGNKVFAVPLLPVKEVVPRSSAMEKALEDKLGLLLGTAGAAGFQLALELVPGNVLGGSSKFLRLVGKPGLGDMRLLLDSGHFWVMGESLGSLPDALVSRIVATHLCDNDGIENLSLCPGDGTVPFADLVDGLVASGYPGSFDIEIVCAGGVVGPEYRKAITRVKSMLPGASARGVSANATIETAAPGRS